MRLGATAVESSSGTVEFSGSTTRPLRSIFLSTPNPIQKSLWLKKGRLDKLTLICIVSKNNRYTGYWPVFASYEFWLLNTYLRATSEEGKRILPREVPILWMGYNQPGPEPIITGGDDEDMSNLRPRCR